MPRFKVVLGWSLCAVICGVLYLSLAGPDPKQDTPTFPVAQTPPPSLPKIQAPEADPFCGIVLSSPVVTSTVPLPASTERMVAMLDRLRREAEANPMEYAYSSQDMIGYWKSELAEARLPAEVVNAQVQLALNRLRAGDSATALEEFEHAEQEAGRLGLDYSPRQIEQLRVLRALCYLRMGEQENCLTNHTSQSCLVPIQSGGVHQLPRGSRGAITLLEEHLERDGSDLTAIWLLNLAYMTLGEYPDQVPPSWRLPPRIFASEYDIKPFPDMAGATGLDVGGLAGGVVLEDFDQDGALDVMVSDWSLTGQLRVFRNAGDGTFTERTAEAGLAGLVGGLNMLQADYNNDGWPDVFIPRGAWLGAVGRHPNSLLRNNGDGTFTDVTEEVGLLSLHPTQTATWLDFDGDGWLDLFIGNESSSGRVHPCELYRNNGGTSFTECAKASGVAVVEFVKGVTSGDYDNDGRPDLFLSVMGGMNMLLRNDGPAPDGAGWRFHDEAERAGVRAPMNSFPTWFFDFDNDGWLDLFVSDYGTGGAAAVVADYLDQPVRQERARLYRNRGDGTFEDVSEEAGVDHILLAMGANYGDLDNDGWLDFYVGTGEPSLSTVIPNRMFRNDGGRRFQDVTTAGGFGHIQKGHGVAFGDLDNDGDQDVYIKMGGAYSGDSYRCSLFQNPGHGNHWVTLKLEGVDSNRSAVGARIRLVVDTPSGERSIYKTVGSGGSFGASPMRQEIGLGPATALRQVEVRWPATGETQQVTGVAMDGFYRIREGDPKAVGGGEGFSLGATEALHEPAASQLQMNN